ncbi:MAG: LVIVD repeat-containing protein [Bradymonadaceae bacterium]
MIRHDSLLWSVPAILMMVSACSGTTDQPAGDQSASPPAPAPGSAKADSTTRETDIKGSVGFNQNIQGQFPADQYVGYTFEVTGEASVGVSVVSDDRETDPAVWLYGPQESDGEWGHDIAENDDISFDNDDAKLSGVELEEPGKYLVVTATEGWDEEGPYTLRVNCSGPGCQSSSDGDGSSGDCSGEMTLDHKVAVGRAGSFVEGTQSGKDLEVVGDTAYMANMQKGVCRFDIAQPRGAELIGCSAPPSDGVTTHRVHDIEIAGNAMYVHNSLEGLWVYDLSDPENPRVIGEFHDAEYFGLDMTLSGDHLYLAARRTGTHILNVSDPAMPTRVGYLADNGAPSPAEESASYATHKIAIAGKIGYFAQRKGGLGIYDLGDPANPTEIGRYRPQKADGAEHRPSVMVVHLEGERAFVAAANDTSNLHLLDISQPEQPSLVWSDQASPERRYWTKDALAVSEGYVALSRGDDRGVELFARDDEGTPSHLGTVEPDGSPTDLHITDDGSVLYSAAANTLRNPRSHLMGLGVIAAGCE